MDFEKLLKQATAKQKVAEKKVSDNSTKSSGKEHELSSIGT